MPCRFTRHTLTFAFTAHTSRETFRTKDTYLLHLTDAMNPDAPERLAEVPVFPSLSPWFTGYGDFERQLAAVCRDMDSYLAGKPLPQNTAIRFGVESLMQHSSRPSGHGININGLVWMNDIDTMQRQVAEKISQGFKCIKLKIGALDFEKELELLRSIRSSFPPQELQLRVDANGAFNVRNVMDRLETLAPLCLHSIEQPLPRDHEYTPYVCRNSPVPIALDEDMIDRWFTPGQMIEWLGSISPAYIVLKPSLTGGFEHTSRWIDAARSLGIGWWATSALESNIGLCSIARWLGQYPESQTFFHGLGTGEIYKENFPTTLRRVGQTLYL